MCAPAFHYFVRACCARICPAFATTGCKMATFPQLQHPQNKFACVRLHLIVPSRATESRSQELREFLRVVGGQAAGKVLAHVRRRLAAFRLQRRNELVLKTQAQQAADLERDREGNAEEQIPTSEGRQTEQADTQYVRSLRGTPATPCRRGGRPCSARTLRAACAAAPACLWPRARRRSPPAAEPATGNPTPLQAPSKE